MARPRTELSIGCIEDLRMQDAFEMQCAGRDNPGMIVALNPVSSGGTGTQRSMVIRLMQAGANTFCQDLKRDEGSKHQESGQLLRSIN